MSERNGLYAAEWIGRGGYIRKELEGHSAEDNKSEVSSEVENKPSAFSVQVGGGHYKSLKIQPAEYCHRNRIGKLEGDVIYYVTRWRDKNGVEDLKKARHTLELIIAIEERTNGL
jgi:hypothetical protein